MSALYQIQRRGCHVIAQVVETELIIRSESDIAGISLTTLVRIRFVLVDTIDRQTEEHIDRTVPFRVTFGEVVVHRHHMDTLVRQRVQINRQRSHEGLTFTGCHLGYLTLMQNNTTEQLHVVMDHIPFDLISSRHPVVLINSDILRTWYLVTLFLRHDFHEIETRVSCQVSIHLRSGHLYRLVLGKTTGGRFDDRICLRQYLIQNALVRVLYLFFQLIYLVVNLLALLNRCSFDGLLQTADF